MGLAIDQHTYEKKFVEKSDFRNFAQVTKFAKSGRSRKLAVSQ